MPWTYTTLVQAIKDWTENDETTFNSQIPNFIRNTEERILHSVQLDVFRRNDAGTTTSGNKYLTAPSDFLAPFAMSVYVNGSSVFLLNKDVEYLQEYNPSGQTGIPKYYALYDVDHFLLAPTPAANYPVELHYYYKPPYRRLGDVLAWDECGTGSPVRLPVRGLHLHEGRAGRPVSLQPTLRRGDVSTQEPRGRP